MSLRNKRIVNDSTKYGRLTIMQQPIVHTYSLGELYTERKEKGDPSLPILTVSIHAGVSEGELDEDKFGKKVKRIADKTQYKTARKGDLVFNMMRAWQGAIGVVRSDGLVSPAYIVAKPNGKIWPEYMDSLRINALMNQIRDIGVPEKMRRHMKIQSIVDALVRSASFTKLRRNGVLDFLP